MKKNVQRLIALLLMITLPPADWLKPVAALAQELSEEEPVLQVADIQKWENKTLIDSETVHGAVSVEGGLSIPSGCALEVTGQLLLTEEANAWGNLEVTGDDAEVTILGTWHGNIRVTGEKARVTVNGKVDGRVQLENSNAPDNSAGLYFHTNDGSYVGEVDVSCNGDVRMNGNVGTLIVRAGTNAEVLVNSNANLEYHHFGRPESDRNANGHVDTFLMYGGEKVHMMWATVDTAYIYDGSYLGHFNTDIKRLFVYGGFVLIHDGSTVEEAWVLGDCFLGLEQGFNPDLPCGMDLSRIHKLNILSNSTVSINGLVDELYCPARAGIGIGGVVEKAYISQSVWLGVTSPEDIDDEEAIIQEGGINLRDQMPPYSIGDLYLNRAALWSSPHNSYIRRAVLDHAYDSVLPARTEQLYLGDSQTYVNALDEKLPPSLVEKLVSFGYGSELWAERDLTVDECLGSVEFGGRIKVLNQTPVTGSLKGEKVSASSETSPLPLEEGEHTWQKTSGNTAWFAREVRTGTEITLSLRDEGDRGILIARTPDDDFEFLTAKDDSWSFRPDQDGTLLLQLIGPRGDYTLSCTAKPEVRIVAEVTALSAAEKAEDQTVKTLGPALLDVRVENLTQGTVLENPVLRDGVLCFAPEAAQSGDRLLVRVTAADGSTAAQEQTVVLGDSKEALVKAELLELGGFRAAAEDGARLHAFLFDADGRLLEEKKVQQGTVSGAGIQDGSYSLLMIRGGIGATLFYDLSEPAEYGLEEGKDYLLLPLEIRAGTIVNQEALAVPPEPVLRAEEFSERSGLSASSVVSAPGGMILCSLELEAVKDITGLTAQIRMMGQSARILPESLVLNGDSVAAEFSENGFTVPLPDGGGHLLFYITASEETMAVVSAALQYQAEGQGKKAYAGASSVNFVKLSLKGPDITPNASVMVSGSGIPGAKVSILENGTVLGNSMCGGEGRYALEVSVRAYRDHVLQARMEVKEDVAVLSSPITIRRAVGAPYLTSMQVDYVEHGQAKSTELKGNALATHAMKFAFEPGTACDIILRIANGDLLKDLTLEVEGNSETLWLEGKYNAVTNEWVCSGVLSEDRNFVPTAFIPHYHLTDDPFIPSETLLPPLGTELISSMVDLSDGKMLSLTRFYPADAACHTIAGDFGMGWNMAFNELALRAEDDSMLFVVSYNNARIFQKTGANAWKEEETGAVANLADGVITVKEKDGAWMRFRDDGLLEQKTAADGNAVQYLYDEAGRPVAQEASYGGSLRITWKDGLISCAELNDQRVNYYYRNQHLVALTGDQNASYGYDGDLESPLRHSLIMASQNNEVFTYAYDANGRVTTGYRDGLRVYISYPEEDLVRFTYAIGGWRELRYNLETMLPVAEEDSSGVTEYTYDDQGRLTSVSLNGFAETYTYSPEGWLLRAENPLQSATYEYNASGLLTAYTAGDRRYEYDMDASGHQTGITWPDGKQERFAYDAAGRPVSHTDRAGQTRQYTWDDQGYPLSEGIGEDQITYEWSEDHRHVAIWQHDQQTYVDIAANGLVEYVEYPDHWHVMVFYDGQGRVTETMYGPDPDPEEVAAHAEKVEAARALVEEAQAKADELEQALQEALAAAEQAAAEEAEAADALPEEAEDAEPAAEVPEEETDEEEAQEEEEEDETEALRLALEEQQLQLETLQDALMELENSWPGIPWVRVAAFEYDDLGVARILDAEDQEIKTRGWDDELTAVVDTFANGVQNIYKFEGNTLGAVLAVKEDDVLWNEGYLYEGTGNLIAKMNDAEEMAVYSYDQLGRLTEVITDQGETSYSYDASGVMTGVTEDGTIREIRSGALGEPLSNGETQYEYDALGRCVRETAGDSVTEYTWNDRDQLTAKTVNGVTTAYTYDVFGALYSMEKDGQVTRLLTLPLSKNWTLAEMTPEGETIEYIFTDDGLEAARKGTDLYCFTWDRVGAAAVVTDGEGSVVNRYAYDEYGARTTLQEQVNLPYTYMGQYGVRTEDQLYQARARWMSPTMRSFLSMDPSDQLYDPNVYRYVKNDPVNFVDFTGKDSFRVPGPGEIPNNFNHYNPNTDNNTIDYKKPEDDVSIFITNEDTSTKIVISDKDYIELEKYINEQKNGNKEGTGEDNQEGTRKENKEGTGEDNQEGTGEDSQEGTGEVSEEGTGEVSEEGTGEVSEEGTGEVSEEGTGEEIELGNDENFFLPTTDEDWSFEIDMPELFPDDLPYFNPEPVNPESENFPEIIPSPDSDDVTDSIPKPGDIETENIPGDFDFITLIPTPEITFGDKFRHWLVNTPLWEIATDELEAHPIRFRFILGSLPALTYLAVITIPKFIIPIILRPIFILIIRPILPIIPRVAASWRRTLIFIRPIPKLPVSNPEVLEKLILIPRNTVILLPKQIVFSAEPDDPDDTNYTLSPVDVDAAIDPSGFIYEAVESNRLKDAKASVFYLNEREETVFWEAEAYDQVNPQQSDEMGLYGWYVPEGQWKVIAEKEGFEPVDSGWMRVPPPQTEVNLGMVSTEAPAIRRAVLYQDSLEITFTRYMRVSSVNENTLLVKGSGLKVLSVVPLNAEEAADGTGQVADRFAVLYTGGATACTVTLTGEARSYADVNAEETQIACSRVGRIQQLAPSAPLTVEAGSGAEYQIRVTADGTTRGMKLTAEMETGAASCTVGETVNGVCNVHLTGFRPGGTALIVTEEATGFRQRIPVTVTEAVTD